ncbi:MAG: AEC family transporter [Bacteroidales bacterium]|nr:AEC family transporter [Bacteroidales bacterium]MDD6732575.1 AEC family transporter [Bacteroidales bacterium]
MDFLHIVTQMLMIFGIVLVGLASAKRNLWAGELDRKLSVFILNVSMPALILASVMGKDLEFEASEVLTLSLVAVVNYVILIGMACLIPKIWHVNLSRQGLARFMLAFGNVSFIGYPVCDAVFGPKAVFCASVLNIPFNLLIFTIGVSFINGGKARSAFSPKLVFSPCVVASLIAVVIALMGISVPAPVGQWFHLLGDLTTPCALLIIGSSLSHIPVRDMLGNRFAYAISLLRLIVLPLVVGVVLRLMGVDRFVANVAVVLSAMPIATNGIMLCLQYGKDERVMTQGLFLSTLFSVVTIPLIAYLTQLF